MMCINTAQMRFMFIKVFTSIQTPLHHYTHIKTIIWKWPFFQHSQCWQSNLQHSSWLSFSALPCFSCTPDPTKQLITKPFPSWCGCVRTKKTQKCAKQGSLWSIHPCIHNLNILFWTRVAGGCWGGGGGGGMGLGSGVKGSFPPLIGQKNRERSITGYQSITGQTLWPKVQNSETLL